MQFTLASVALFAALASAHQHSPKHFHRRQYNTTEGPSTTLTVFATSVYTITSCAATVTDCPARPNESTSKFVVTKTIDSTTTVCPVSAAESISSKIASSYAASASTAGGVVSTPVGTGYPTKGAVTAPSIPLSTGVASGPDTTPYPSGSESVVLTYTLGSGTSTTVVTTTIKHTKTATVYATKSGEAEVTPKQGNANSGEKTTTITGTSTSTRYVTVKPVSSGAAGSSALGGASAPATGGCVPVTVTVALSTVTVTETAAASPLPTGGSGIISSAQGVKAVDTSSASKVTILSTATVVPVLSTGAPYSNGTAAATASTKKKCSSVFPSGFISKTKIASGTASIKPAPTDYPTAAAYPTGYAY